MPKWKAIVFDLDDTLYPERQYVLSGFQAVAAYVAEQWDLAEESTYLALKGYFDSNARGDIFNRWLAKEDLEAKINISDLLQVYRAHQPTLSPFPEVPALLTELSAKFPLGLVSDGYLAVQKKKWEALKLHTHFRSVIFSDQWGRGYWKPHIRPFLEVTKQLGVAPQDAVYIADNPKKDFLGARNAGLASIWIRRPGGEYENLTPESESHAAAFTFLDFNGVAEFLDG